MTDNKHSNSEVDSSSSAEESVSLRERGRPGMHPERHLSSLIHFPEMTRREFIVALAATALATTPLLGCSGGTSQWPQPAAGCAFFTQDYALPQTQSAKQLAEYLATEHFEYDLDGWFFMGNLVEGMETDPAPDDTGVFFIAVQRIEIESADYPGLRVPFFPAIVGFNSASLKRYIYGAVPALDIAPLVVVTPEPWSVEVNWFTQQTPLISMSLVEGSMGAAGAVYRLVADLPDLEENKRFQAEVLLRDRLGVVNQGYGSASFFPQFLTEAQRQMVVELFRGSVPDYLESTGDPMSCQGSYYYSLPLLDVEQFTIMHDGVTLSSGNRGTMWMDNVVQTYNQRAQEVFSKASWLFFAIRLPEESAAIMVIQIKSATGTLRVATLFGDHSGQTRNFARKSIHSWDINEIEINGVQESIWTSQKTDLPYFMQYRTEARISSSTASCIMLDFTFPMSIQSGYSSRTALISILPCGSTD